MTLKELLEIGDTAPGGGCNFGPVLGSATELEGEEIRENPVAPIREERVGKYAEYVGGWQPFSASLHPVRKSKHLMVPTPWGWLRVKGENSKVKYPIFSFESGRGCSSRFRCGFSGTNRKKDYPLCYAQAGENAYPAVELANAYQQEVMDRILREASSQELEGVAIQVADAAEKLFATRAKRGERRVLRFNDTGDVPEGDPRAKAMNDVIFQRSLHFMEVVVARLHDYGFTCYLYTKHIGSKLAAIESVNGLNVMRSEKDFVVAKPIKKGKEVVGVVLSKTGEPVPADAEFCPGFCGVPPKTIKVPVTKRGKDGKDYNVKRTTPGGKSVNVTKNVANPQKSPCYLCTKHHAEVYILAH